jgi:membrane protein implicated in regulation of membrane protease activity
MATPRLLVIFSLATLLVVLMVAALATESWWVLAAALCVHLTATVITVGAIRRFSEQREKPDPVTEARVEEERKGSTAGQEARRSGQGEDEPKMAI